MSAATERVRLVATDLDGTLLRSDGTVSPRSREALRAAADAGLHVAFVSGRPPRWLDVLAEDVGRLGMAVAANGAVLYDMADETMVVTHTLSPAELAGITRDLRSEFPAVLFAVEYGLGFGAEAAYVHDWQISPLTDRRGRPMAPPLIADLAEIIAEPAVKLLAKDRSADPDEFMHAATRLLGERVTITHSSSIGLLEISAAGVTKATGLAQLAGRHGIGAAEVVAIGDMPNDLAMLEWAGRSYAVANAHPDVLAAADEVTVRNDDDAVALLIESVLDASA